MPALTRTNLPLNLGLALILATVVSHCMCPLVASQTTSSPTSGPPSSPSEQPETQISPSGQLIEANDDILTPKGEVPVDFETNKKLPEEMDDGELEAGDTHTGWNYNDQSSWAGEYPICRGMKLRQSPIDIMTDKVIFGPKMHLEFIDYDQQVEFEIKNTHHSVSLTPIGSVSKPRISVNFVPGADEFELQEIHFHWGDGINKGSEHEIDDQKAAAEMHMVHYRKGLDKSQIGQLENSVAVVGVLIESDMIEHNKLEPIVKKCSAVNGTDAEYKDVDPFNLISVLPDNHHGFYTYNGSLTTPPCYEVVTWIVMSEPVYMSQEKLVELSNLEVQTPVKGRIKIARNYRDVQPLLDRPVYASFNTSDKNDYIKLDSDEKQAMHLDNSQKKAEWNQRVSQAMKDYWQQVNSLRGSVRKAFKSIDDARKKLWARIRHRGTQDQTSDNSTTTASPVFLGR